ncbi:sensor histidine kinase [Thalassospira lucentensis]|uniref:sensor histidine kinase n=1 Tax=Thalassospira lucentensis TaxID=168935 RepID=UPI00142DDAB5|nr:sensor histidine kinase [Thalassospira lucentensis]NIZ03910.1 sensor histidine kinase [Thalassospira lucentensis]
MSEEGVFTIRPAGRHILTIGRDLIQDPYAAVVELVKNAFDADSEFVQLDFRAKPSVGEYCIVISDGGHGMSRDDVVERWLVPSTNDKLKRKLSPNGRVLQGRKGVGRFAASILGDDLLLETTTKSGEKTSVFVEWETFEAAHYLDQVELLIETRDAGEQAGTVLTIKGGQAGLEEWNDAQFRRLQYELRKLTPPVAAVSGVELKQEKFEIQLKISGFQGVPDTEETISSFPILEFYDYMISGTVDENGAGVLRYSTQKIENASAEQFSVDFSGFFEKTCGSLSFDIRVYDRNKDDIDQIIRRGLKDKDGHYLGNLAARQLLNFNNGIGVYRNGFRIRPLGDAQFDWLKLNQQRIQNPSRKVGSNQVIGFVHIESEEKSGLVEKSARDGLKENAAYQRLIEVTTKVIEELEARRFALRRSLELGKPKSRVEKQIRQLFSDDHIRVDVLKRLERSGIGESVIKEISELLAKDIAVKNKAAESLRQTVAVYQGQATLGKIVNVVLHEGRRPLNFFKNQVPNLEYWGGVFEKDPTSENLDNILPIARELGHNADVFAQLFGRLDPLAAGKRAEPASFNLLKVLQGAFKVFDNTLRDSGINFGINGPGDFEFIGWKQDFYAIFTNLIDNSIYWMSEKKVDDASISIRFEVEDGKLSFIDYRDSGPGIDKSLIESEVIFDPEFSTKTDGTGLGLAIAGEAASRNGLELNVLDTDRGAYFRLQRADGE